MKFLIALLLCLLPLSAFSAGDCVNCDNGTGLELIPPTQSPDPDSCAFQNGEVICRLAGARAFPIGGWNVPIPSNRPAVDSQWVIRQRGIPAAIPSEGGLIPTRTLYNYSAAYLYAPDSVQCSNMYDNLQNTGNIGPDVAPPGTTAGQRVITLNMAITDIAAPTNAHCLWAFDNIVDYDNFTIKMDVRVALTDAAVFGGKCYSLLNRWDDNGVALDTYTGGKNNYFCMTRGGIIRWKWNGYTHSPTNSDIRGYPWWQDRSQCIAGQWCSIVISVTGGNSVTIEQNGKTIFEETAIAGMTPSSATGALMLAKRTCDESIADADCLTLHSAPGQYFVGQLANIALDESNGGVHEREKWLGAVGCGLFYDQSPRGFAGVNELQEPYIDDTGYAAGRVPCGNLKTGTLPTIILIGDSHLDRSATAPNGTYNLGHLIETEYRARGYRVVNTAQWGSWSKHWKRDCSAPGNGECRQTALLNTWPHTVDNTLSCELAVVSLSANDAMNGVTATTVNANLGTNANALNMILTKELNCRGVVWLVSTTAGGAWPGTYSMVLDSYNTSVWYGGIFAPCQGTRGPTQVCVDMTNRVTPEAAAELEPLPKARPSDFSADLIHYSAAGALRLFTGAVKPTIDALLVRSYDQ